MTLHDCRAQPPAPATFTLGRTEPAGSQSCCSSLMGAVIYMEHDGLQQVL